MSETKDTRFKPGKSGNPNGRPAGSRSKVLLALDALGEGEAVDILTAMIKKANDGDAQAGRTILERVWPARKGARLKFDLPEVTNVQDMPEAVDAINRQVAQGELSPDEATLIVGLLDAHRRAIETSELSARLDALEARLGRK